MATHNLATGEVGTNGVKTLTASTEDTVNFAGDPAYTEVIVPQDSPVGLWYTNNGTAATVNGAQCFYVPPGASDRRLSRSSGKGQVRLISSGAATYRVQEGD